MNTETQNEKQLAKMVCHRVMSVMKFILSLEEFSYREQGRNDPRYKTFKQQVMANTYENLRDLFADMSNLGLIQKTEYDEDVKGGYRDTLSGGSGYINTDNLNKLLS